MRRHGWPGPGEREAGTAAVEAAIVVLPLILLFLLAIALGRATQASSTVQGAATDAARAASIARNPVQAAADGRAAGARTLHQGGLACTPTISIDTSGFGTAPGTVAVVRAHVTCTVSFTGLGRLPVGSHTVTAEATSPLDVYRER